MLPTPERITQFHSQGIVQWLIEDLRARNAEIIEKDKQRLQLANFGLLVLAGIFGLMAQNPDALNFEWGPPIALGVAVFFAFLGHQALYSALFSVVSSSYIRDDLLPRIEATLHDETILPYGWENYLWNVRRSSPVAMSALFVSEGGVFALPSFGFTAYGFKMLFGLQLRSAPARIVFWVLVVALGWLAFAACHTAWRLVNNRKTFR